MLRWVGLAWRGARAALVVLAVGAWLSLVDVGVARTRGVGVGANPLPVLFLEHVLVTLVLAIGLFLAALVAERACLRWGGSPWRRAVCWSVVYGVAALVPAVLMGNELGRGDWVSQRWFAPVVRAGIPTTVILSVMVLAGHVGWRPRAPFWPYVWLGGTIAGSYLNGRLFVGYYSAFHLGVHAFVVALSLAAFARLSGALERCRCGALAAVLAWTCVLGAAWGGRTLLPRTREVALRVSPALAIAVPWLVPRADRNVLRSAILADAAPHARTSTEPIQLGRKPKNVVVILVDALRADALSHGRRGSTLASRAGDTPFLDRWLASAYRFTSAYAQASRTNRSVPSALHSSEPFESPTELHLPRPAARARELGLSPIAVLPDWYLLPNSGEAGALLDGFDSVSTYLRFGSQGQFVPYVRRALDEVGEKPFFLWLHYYGMHWPHFIGEGKEHPAGATASDMYRAALRFMDGQLERVVEALRAKGALDDSLIVLMADHGEFLGERGLTRHGQGVAPEEVHVPLAIWVPEAGGGDVDAVCGNIDVVPTVFELLGDQSGVRVRGRSLVPEMATLARESDRALYAMSATGGRRALFTQEHVLHYEAGGGVFSLYDRVDRAQESDRFGDVAELDARLVAEFVRRNPALFEEQLEDNETRAALLGRLVAPPHELSLGQLEFLLELAALDRGEEVLAVASRVYERSSETERKLAAVVRLHRTDERMWGARATALLASARGKPEEAVIVGALIRAGLRSLEGALVSERVSELAREDCTSRLNGAWLVLAGAQRDFARIGEAALSAQLDCALRRDSSGRAGVLGRALSSVGQLSPYSRPALETTILPLVDHEDDWVTVAAVRGLASVGGDVTRKALASRLDVGWPAPQTERLVEGAILTLARLEGASLTPKLLEWGKIDARRFAVVRALADVGDERSLPFLAEKVVGNRAMNSATARARRTVLSRLQAQEKAKVGASRAN